MVEGSELDVTDQELVREIRAGSSVAFERLMRRYRRLVYRVAFGYTGDGEAAMDVTQETFLKVYARLDSWRHGTDLKSWIARIAANEALNWVRSARRHPTSELDEAFFRPVEPSQEDEVARRESRDALHRSLSSLSPRQRLAVALRYFEGMSGREIADVLECGEDTVRNILFRSLQKLRSVLVGSEESLP